MKKIEIVQRFCYLGIVMSQNGNFKSAFETLANKGSKVYASLYNMLNVFSGCPVKVMLKLVEVLIEPVMLYGCEVWGAFLCKKLSTLDNIFSNTKLPFCKLYIKMCKQILGVKKNSSNLPVLAELGVYPIIIKVLRQVYKYALRLINYKKNSLMGQAAIQQRKLMTNGSISFFNIVKFINVSLNLKIPTRIMTPDAALQKKQIESVTKVMIDKLKEKYQKFFKEKIATNAKLANYVKLKQNYGFETYLSNIKDIHLRRSVTKFRISAHQLPIEVGRYHNIPKSQRLCGLCNAVGDEKHYILHCKNVKISTARVRCTQQISRKITVFNKLDNNSKFLYIMLCSDVSIQNDIAHFLRTIDEEIHA